MMQKLPIEPCEGKKESYIIKIIILIYVIIKCND